MTTAPEAAPVAVSHSVTSLDSADIDPHLLGQQEPPHIAQPVAESAEPSGGGGSGGGGFARGDSSRISMRRNTVPLMRQDALRNGAPTDAASAAAAASSSRTGRGHQQVCRYCLRLFDDRRNPKGACTEAPDRLKACIDRLTCLTLADGVSYHCCADSEGDYIQPCQLLARHRRDAARRGDSENGNDDYNCGRGGNHGGGEDEDAEEDDDQEDDADGARSTLLDRLKAWSCVCLLALFVPCLCCYPACSLAHQACQRLHLAGGRHVALWTDPGQPVSSGVKKDPTRNTIAGMVAAEDSNTAAIDGVNVSVA